jgi:uncharacterized membrane protein
VDDCFPTRGGGSGGVFGGVLGPLIGGQSRTLRQLAFAGSRNGRLWAALVEKAYAKLCGGCVKAQRPEFF